MLGQKPGGLVIRRTNFADRAFRCSAPAVWNSLTADIVDFSSLLIYKPKLKTFLFRHAFSP